MPLTESQREKLGAILQANGLLLQACHDLTQRVVWIQELAGDAEEGLNVLQVEARIGRLRSFFVRVAATEQALQALRP